MQNEQGSLEIKAIKENPTNPNQYVATVALPGFNDESAYFDKKDFQDMPQPGYYVVQYRRVGAKKSIKVESWELSSPKGQQPLQQQQEQQEQQEQPQQPQQPQPKYISVKDIIIYMESTMTDATSSTNNLFSESVKNFLIEEFKTNVQNADPKDILNYLVECYGDAYTLNLKTMAREGIDKYWELRNEQDMS